MNDDLEYDNTGEPLLGEDDEITFDDAPAQVKPTVSAPKAAPAKKAAPKAKRKPTVAKAAVAKAPRKSHKVETIDNNKLAQYLDKLTNDDGYELLSVAGSSSIMGAFTVVSVKTV